MASKENKEPKAIEKEPEEEPDKKAVYVLSTAYKDDDSEVIGVFSSFDKAVMYFVRTLYKDANMGTDMLLSACARAALKLSGQTDDDDVGVFGNTRVSILEMVVDDGVELFEEDLAQGDTLL